MSVRVAPSVAYLEAFGGTAVRWFNWQAARGWALPLGRGALVARRRAPADRRFGYVVLEHETHDRPLSAYSARRRQIGGPLRSAYGISRRARLSWLISPPAGYYSVVGVPASRSSGAPPGVVCPFPTCGTPLVGFAVAESVSGIGRGAAAPISCAVQGRADLELPADRMLPAPRAEPALPFDLAM